MGDKSVYRVVAKFEGAVECDVEACDKYDAAVKAECSIMERLSEGNLLGAAAKVYVVGSSVIK